MYMGFYFLVLLPCANFLGSEKDGGAKEDHGKRAFVQFGKTQRERRRDKTTAQCMLEQENKNKNTTLMNAVKTTWGLII